MELIDALRASLTKPVRKRKATTRDTFEAAGAQHERERLRPLLERCLAHLTGEDRGETCSAVIGHGPGHQSQTTCEVRGPHTIHRATYGSADQVARWTGEKKAFTGCFDEPPSESAGLRLRWFAERDGRAAIAERLRADLAAELGKRRDAGTL